MALTMASSSFGISGGGLPLVMARQFSWNSLSFQTFANAPFKVFTHFGEYWAAGRMPAGIA